MTTVFRHFALVCAVVIPLAASASALDAQRRGRSGYGGGECQGAIEPNIPYDGRFTFARIRYREVYSTGWQYDYPCTERNFAQILREITAIRPYMEGGNVFDFDDPELFRFPIAYVSEPGFWYPTDAEAAGLRTFLAKGGFVIFDDFNYANEWMVFESGLRRALPDAQIVPLDPSHAVFDSFFRIASLDMTYPGRPSLPSEFYGIYEDNDPKKRLMVVINFNNDLGNYIEHSAGGWYPVNLTNDAYKFAVNYIIYGMTR
jgi:hypothetical protein